MLASHATLVASADVPAATKYKSKKLLTYLQQVIKPAKVEVVGEAEQQEAWHRHLSTEMDGQCQVEVYRRRYLQWLKQPMLPCTAYIQRASMHLQAKCYLQVQHHSQIPLQHCQAVCLQQDACCLCCLEMAGCASGTDLISHLHE